MKRLLVLLLTLGVFAGIAYAHNGMQHVMGTVTAITPANLTVKGMDGKIETIALTNDTKYMKGKQSITQREVKPGDNVVVHATKKDGQLTASEVKVGAMKGMDNMQGMKGMKMDGNSKQPQ